MILELRFLIVIEKMSSQKFKLEIFNYSQYFTLWKVKMRDLMDSTGLYNSFRRRTKLPNDRVKMLKNDIMAKVHNAIM